MGNYYGKYEYGYKYKQDDSISKPLNKYCEDLYGIGSCNMNEVYENKKKILSAMEINSLSDEIVDQLLNESWGRKSDRRFTGATIAGMGSYEILLLWENKGMYTKLKKINDTGLYDLNNLTRNGDNILVNIKNEKGMKILIITDELMRKV